MRFLLDDERMEQAMGVLLRFGVVLAGAAFYLQDHAHQPISYSHFVEHPFSLQHRRELLLGISHGDAASIIEVGILLLIATPVARVAFAVAAFALERDRLYTAISMAVLAVLAYSLLFGK
jgi:uncharacterized membrane protein